MAPVTSFDVARLAGVSRSSVSRAFTPGASVSSKTRKKVHKSAAKLGYKVNLIARSLINQRSNIIGLVASDFATPLRGAQIASLSRAFMQRQLHCMLVNTAEAEDDIDGLIELVLQYQATAIVIMSGTPPSVIAERCVAQGIAVIMVDKPSGRVPADAIASDNAYGGRTAGEVLIRAGSRRLCLVSSSGETQSLIERREAFEFMLSGLDVQLCTWHRGEASYETGLAAAREILGRGERPDGVFCVTDLLALGFMDGARHEFGLRIPEDLRVVGFDDIPQASWASYQLTTFRQSTADLAAAIADILDRRLEEPSLAPISIQWPAELVLRRSTEFVESR